MEDKSFNRIVNLAIVVTAIIAAYFYVLYVSRIGETKVSIQVIPADAKVTINDQPASDGVKYLSPGRYTFKAAKSGWETYSLTINLENTPVELGLIPEPMSESAASFLENNPATQLRREAIGGKNSDLIGQEQNKETPLLKTLPYEDIYGPFEVDYGPSPLRDNGIFIKVSSSTPPGRIKFQQWLKSQGYNPADLEIQYTDFDNPFIGEDE